MYDDERPQTPSNLINYLSADFLYCNQNISSLTIKEEGYFNYTTTNDTFGGAFRDGLPYRNYFLYRRKYRLSEYVQNGPIEYGITNSISLNPRA